MMKCKVCGEMSVDFGNAVVMGKYEAHYSRCVSCGCIFADDPHWLHESYGNAITNTDLGSVSRTESNSKQVKMILDYLFKSSGKFLDYGAGYGMFVRRMRDLGYDFRAYDRYCENLFSREFTTQLNNSEKYDVITAFEVVEHAEKPMDFFEKLFSYSETVLFTTEIIPMPPPKPGTWWYYALEHGQHISFYTVDALKYIARYFKRKLYTNNSSLHLISSAPIKQGIFDLCLNTDVVEWNHFLKKRPSLLEQDWHLLRRQTLRKLGYPDDCE